MKPFHWYSNLSAQKHTSYHLKTHETIRNTITYICTDMKDVITDTKLPDPAIAQMQSLVVYKISKKILISSDQHIIIRTANSKYI